MWKDSVSRALRLEQQKVGSIRQMMQQTDNPDRLRAYGQMLADTVEVVTILNELLLYKDRKESDDDG